MTIPSNVLVESRSARDEGIACLSTHETGEATLNKVKSVLFGLWRGVGYLTSQQVADYYAVSDDVVRQNLRRNRSEFEQDGVARIDGDDLRDARDIMSLPSRTSQVTLFPPRAVLRMGFILQESEVAAKVRTVTLNVLQGVGQVVDEGVLDRLILGHPVLNPFCEAGSLNISAPLAPHFKAIERTLKRKFPNGPIPGLKKKDIREKLAALSTYTQRWKFDTQAELRFPVGAGQHMKYPDLVSPVVEFEVDGQVKSAVFLFQISDFLVEMEDVETASGKQFVKVCREHYQVDYAFVFLVSPLGATPDAEAYIKDCLPNEMRGFFGVMTVKELANILVAQARNERKSNLMKGEVKQNFADILNYNIPTEPLIMMMMME